MITKTIRITLTDAQWLALRLEAARNNVSQGQAASEAIQHGLAA
jgi:hypothetical protein